MQYEGEESEDDLPQQHGLEVEGEDEESEDVIEEVKEVKEEVKEVVEEEVEEMKVEEKQEVGEKEKEKKKKSESLLFRESAIFRELCAWEEARGGRKEEGFSFLKKLDTSVTLVGENHSDGTPLPKHLRRLRLLNQNLYATNKELYQTYHEHRCRVIESLHSKVTPISSQTSSTLLTLQRTSRNLSSMSLSLCEAVSTLPQFWNIYGIDAESK
eukprot:TRINITY_DN31281_c0_g1_i1.p1 TRINITY_DN31281_c0_g1~~TRINITY_DN31281_c0_g1_i1.p1  ORF type:complete len:213 (+),score=53.74 TRINITY_DN31281_c0_g1_i1:158-796(+)